jgi:soluble lytic murein transglycosylase-like protein
MKKTIAICLCATLLPLMAASAPKAGSIFYYQDENGVFHYTNVPSDSGKWTFFAFFKSASPKDREAILRKVEESSKRYGLDKNFVEAVIRVESNYEPEAVSHKGAQGLMQIMPGTQRELGISDPFNIDQNIEAGVRYLRSQIDRFGSYQLALAAYNAGPEAVKRYNGIPPYPETQAYVRKVLETYNKLRTD